MKQGEKNARKFLESRFDDHQIEILSYCLIREIPVCFYGFGLGKSTARDRLHEAGFLRVYAPEDCGAGCDALTVADFPGAVALRVKAQEPSGTDIPEGSFTDSELRFVIEDASRHTH